tara:strand:+ start:259 stop:429 length:171 start_codon:yes stop_codon:yes gene_type:complete
VIIMTERSQTIIGSELLDDHEIHKIAKIVDRIIRQMSPEEQDKLEDAEVFVGYWHD